MFLSGPFYSHQVLNDEFPGICFLEDPVVVTIKSEPVTISPPGHGITVKIPPNALKDTNKPANISLQTCLFSSVFQYPEGCTPFSAVYHISSDSVFDKDIELTIEHFADLVTDKQTNKMTFFRAESEGKGKYLFTPIKGGEFQVGSHNCTIFTRQFSFTSAGSEASSEISEMTFHNPVCNNSCMFVQVNDTSHSVAILT